MASKNRARCGAGAFAAAVVCRFGAGSLSPQLRHLSSSEVFVGACDCGGGPPRTTVELEALSAARPWTECVVVELRLAEHRAACPPPRSPFAAAREAVASSAAAASSVAAAWLVASPAGALA